MEYHEQTGYSPYQSMQNILWNKYFCKQPPFASIIFLFHCCKISIDNSLPSPLYQPVRIKDDLRLFIKRGTAVNSLPQKLQSSPERSSYRTFCFAKFQPLHQLLHRNLQINGSPLLTHKCHVVKKAGCTTTRCDEDILKLSYLM